MIDAFRSFEAVVAAGSFAAAARWLGLDEATLHERLRALEAQYGVVLFEPTVEPLRLTAAGARLAEHGARLLATLDDLARDLRGLELSPGRADEGVLEIAASPIPGEAILPLLLPRFQALRPDVQLRETVGETRDVVARLLRREVELAIIGGPFQDDRAEAAFFARDEFALVAPRDHPLAGQGPLRAVDVCRYPLVLRGEGTGARLAVEAALQAAGVEPSTIQVAAELGSTEAVKRAVEAGLGVGYVSVCTLAIAGPAGELRALPLAEGPPARDLLVLTERGRPRSELADYFRAFLLSTETLREVAGYTRLPAALRPAPFTTPDHPRASPATGLESDPLLPTVEPAYRLAREPRSSEERLVARELAQTAGGARAELLARVSDALRRDDDDPLSSAPDIALYRLELYRAEAAALVDRLVGDLLVESGTGGP